MLIYNYNKEFIGMDEGSLNLFSLSNLAELQSYVSDFADLFVKAPGYVHNFKNIHWIDYIECDGEDQKVIINIKDKTYSAHISTKTIYLSDEPSQKAHIVYLKGVKSLSQSESKLIFDQASQSPTAKPVTPKSTIAPKDLMLEEDILTQAVFDPYDLPIDKIVQEEKKIDLVQESKKPVEAKEEIIPQNTQKPSPLKIQNSVQSKIEEFEDRHFANYVYNPIPASEELGLSVDLIEEFVQDFIDQAESFKDALYENIQNHDLSKLKIEADKLKGVAANLKIEDALDVLNKINISQDPQTAEIYLGKFYAMIERLSNRSRLVKEHEQNTPEAKVSDDMLVLTFKDDAVATKNVVKESYDKIEIEDSLIPDSIELPELADDEFLKQPIKTDNSKKEDEIFFEEEFIDDIALYDKKAAANEIGLDKEGFEALFEDYLIQSRELVNLITKSAKENDLAVCKNTAAKLKETSAKMRVHSFDADLEAIISADDTTILNILSEDITSILDRLSNIQA